MPVDLILGSQTPDKLVDAAFVMAESGDVSSAIVGMEAACRLDDANKAVQEMLAQFYLEGDRPDDAVKAAQRAVALDHQARHSISPCIHVSSSHQQETLNVFILYSGQKQLSLSHEHISHARPCKKPCRHFTCVWYGITNADLMQI